jgi:cytochrome c biogenesis protein CcdA
MVFLNHLRILIAEPKELVRIEKAKPMSENRTMSIMLFVLGLFLIAVGIGLSTVTQTVTTPHQETIHPYVGVGVFMVLFGIIVLVFAFIRTMSKRTFSMRQRWRYPQTEQV